MVWDCGVAMDGDAGKCSDEPEKIAFQKVGLRFRFRFIGLIARGLKITKFEITNSKVPIHFNTMQ